MRRAIALLLILFVSMALASPSSVLRVMNYFLSPTTAIATHADGSISHMTMDIRIPPPAWLRLPHGTRIVSAVSTTFNNKPDIFGTADITVPMTAAETRQYFARSLAADGFAVRDYGAGPRHDAAPFVPREADTIGGVRDATQDEARITLGHREGVFIRVQAVQLVWHHGPDRWADRPR